MMMKDVCYRVLVSLLLTAILVVPAAAEWVDFTMPWNDGSESFFYDPLDLDTPAGKYGFVQVGPEGHFQVGGARIRFWGIVIPGGAAFPSASVGAQTAERLAKLGFNLVTFHHLDSSLLGLTCDGPLHADRLSRLNDFIDELKARGIYVGLGLFEGRTYGSCPTMDGPLTSYQCRLVSLFDPAAIDLQKSYASQFLLDTGLVNEPAVAMVKLINEVSLFVAWQSGGLNDRPNDPLPDRYLDELDDYWNDWLCAQYDDRTELEDAWEGGIGQKGLESGEDPGAGTVRRVSFPSGTPPEYTWNRYLDTARFYRDLERKYFQTMVDYLKNDLGLQVPISAVHNFYGLGNKVAIYEDLDYMSQNVQWEHPWECPESAWTLPTTFLNTPLVHAETTPIPSYYPAYGGCADSGWDEAWIEKKNTVYKAAFGSAFEGKPFVINEHNHHFPNAYQAEFPVIISSYGCLQDWDGIVIHEYSHSASESYLAGDAIESFFETFNNPVLMAQMPVAARIFRDGLVAEALSTVNVAYSLDYSAAVESDPEWPGPEGPIDQLTDESLLGYFDCQIDPHCYPDSLNLGNAVDMHAPLISKVRNQITEAPTSPAYAAGSSPYTSDTSQLEWDTEGGLVKVDAPDVQAIIGFFGAGSVSTEHLEIEATTDFGSVSLLPLDGKSVALSEALLLTVPSRVKNLTLDVDPADAYGTCGGVPCTVNSWGEGVVVWPVEAEITLCLPGAATVRVHALDGTGNPLSEITVDSLGGNEFAFDIGGDDTLWYGIEVTRVEDTAASFRVTSEGDLFADGDFAAQRFLTGSADVAEWVPVSEPVEPCDVLELDPSRPGAYRKSSCPNSLLVAGIVSTAPGVMLGAEVAEGESGRALLALIGMVPVKVTDEGGAIQPGDLLVSSSVPGVAMRWQTTTDGSSPHLIGKALEPLVGGTGVILALLMGP